MTVTVDTEEDNWGLYEPSGQTVANIDALPRLQQLLGDRGVRPTYFVNRPPLLDARATAVLRSLVDHEGVEVAAHCHPWNTPPFGSDGRVISMMNQHPVELNEGKIQEVVRLLGEGLGVVPTSFRAGRWGFGPTVSKALARLGFEVDASVSPFLDWRRSGGMDFRRAPLHPYRFDPASPLVIDPMGSMAELPSTVGFLGGEQRRANRVREYLQNHRLLSRMKVVGVLDSVGLFARRWLSPETTSLSDLTKLAQSLVARGYRYLDLSMHSGTMLPGATPFVKTGQELEEYIARLDGFLDFAQGEGYRFRTVGEVATELVPRQETSDTP